jgi:CBS domain-containing protein
LDLAQKDRGRAEGRFLHRVAATSGTVPGEEVVRMDLDATRSVSDVMSVQPVFVEPETTLRRITEVLTDEAVGAVVVLGASGLVGLVSERDVVRAIANGADPDIMWAADVMAQDLVSTTSDEPLFKVMLVMAEHSVRHVPVVDEGELVGMVSARDVIRGLTDTEPAP